MVQPLVRIPDEIERIGYRMIGCGITVHRILGPGCKERASNERRRGGAWTRLLLIGGLRDLRAFVTFVRAVGPCIVDGCL
jgi:hypothetical protein